MPIDRLQSEIRRTERHLAKLRQALKGLEADAGKAGVARHTEDLIRLRRRKGAAIPRITSAHWLAYLGREARTLAQLVNIAVLALQVDTLDRRLVANRASVWLNSAVKAGTVRIAGKVSSGALYKAAPVSGRKKRAG